MEIPEGRRYDLPSSDSESEVSEDDREQRPIQAELSKESGVMANNSLTQLQVGVVDSQLIDRLTISPDQQTGHNPRINMGSEFGDLT